MESEREGQMQQLARMLLFQVEKHGDRFTLTRTADTPKPVRHENLTLAECEEVLNTWKLRGFHGG
jgi:hypothetical protein